MHSSSLAFLAAPAEVVEDGAGGFRTFFWSTMETVAEDVEIVIPDIHAPTLTVPVSASYSGG